MTTVSNDQLQKWASRQLADYDNRTPGTLFGEGLVLDVEQAYELQSAVAQLRCERGDQVIGYKVGCTSPQIRAQLGISHSVTGRLYESEQHKTGSTLSRSQFASLAIEGELAVILSREPEEADFLSDGIPGCIAHVLPVIELHNHVMRGEEPSASELIANNAIHAGFIAGDGVDIEDLKNERLPELLTLSIHSDGETLADCAGDELIRTINSSLKWLTATVQSRGDRLQQGQVILTGSIPSLFPIDGDCCIRVDAGPFGSVDGMFVN